MKISGASSISAAEQARMYQPLSGGAAPAQKSGEERRFDRVTLSGGDGARSSFEMEMRSRLSQEVRTATSSGQIAKLREQVRSGSYHIDPMGIARGMLLLGEAG